MVSSCCASACTQRAIKGSSISFHSFPKDPIVRRKWLVALGREEVSESIKVCGKHFQESDYIFQFGRKRLKVGIVPTIFDHRGHLKKPVVRKRKSRAARGEQLPKQIEPTTNNSSLAPRDKAEKNETELADVKPCKQIKLTINTSKKEVEVMDAMLPKQGLTIKNTSSAPRNMSEELAEDEIESNFEIMDSKLSQQTELIASQSPRIKNEELAKENEVELKTEIMDVMLAEQIELITQAPRIKNEEETKIESKTEDMKLPEQIELTTPPALRIKNEEPSEEIEIEPNIELMAVKLFEQIKLITKNTLLASTVNSEPLEENKAEIQIKTLKGKRNVRQPIYFGDYKFAQLKTDEARRLWHVANRQIRSYRSKINLLTVKVHRQQRKIQTLQDLLPHLKNKGRISKNCFSLVYNNNLN